MLSWTKNGVALAVILAWLGSSISAAEPLSILREERHLRVAGISETWRLSWASLPRGRCQECQSARKRDPQSASKRDPFMTRRTPPWSSVPEP